MVLQEYPTRSLKAWLQAQQNSWIPSRKFGLHKIAKLLGLNIELVGQQFGRDKHGLFGHRRCPNSIGGRTDSRANTDVCNLSRRSLNKLLKYGRLFIRVWRRKSVNVRINTIAIPGTHKLHCTVNIISGINWKNVSQWNLNSYTLYCNLFKHVGNSIKSWRHTEACPAVQAVREKVLSIRLRLNCKRGLISTSLSRVLRKVVLIIATISFTRGIHTHRIPVVITSPIWIWAHKN